MSDWREKAAARAVLDQCEAKIHDSIPSMREFWRNANEQERIAFIHQLQAQFDDDIVTVLVGLACGEEDA